MSREPSPESLGLNDKACRAARESRRDGGAWCTMVDEGGFEGIRQVASASGPGSGQGAGAAHMPAGTFKSGASS